MNSNPSPFLISLISFCKPFSCFQWQRDCVIWNAMGWDFKIALRNCNSTISKWSLESVYICNEFFLPCPLSTLRSFLCVTIFLISCEGDKDKAYSSLSFQCLEHRKFSIYISWARKRMNDLLVFCWPRNCSVKCFWRNQLRSWEIVRFWQFKEE